VNLAIRKQSNARRSYGFTLIELVVAVAIVAMLSMIALPSFMDSVRKSRRIDAQTALTAASYDLERFFGANGTYTTDTSELGLLVDDDVAYSDDRSYVMTVAAGGTGIGSSYVVTATAASGTMQADDTGCTVLTVSSLGQRTPDPTTSHCW
jgi:type IV pilus assembly protein PilE